MNTFLKLLSCFKPPNKAGYVYYMLGNMCEYFQVQRVCVCM